MVWSVTLAGRTFTQANVEGNAYADEENGLPAILRAVAETAGTIAGVWLTSSSTRFANVGSFDLITHQSSEEINLPIGTLVRAVSTSDPSIYVLGTVISFTGNILIIDSTIASVFDAGTGWVIGHPYMVVRSLMLDPDPTLSADLNANGRAIVNSANLESYAATLGAAYALSL